MVCRTQPGARCFHYIPGVTWSVHRCYTCRQAPPTLRRAICNSGVRRITILGVAVDDVTEEEVLDRIAGFIATGGPHQIATVNPEFVMEARRNVAFRAVLA